MCVSTKGIAVGMRRVVILGTSGSGKTTFAEALATRLGCRHIELDALHWHQPNWELPTVEDFRERVAAAIVDDRWVTDGNYSSARDLVWGRADTLVWLDYPFPLTLLRLIRRTLWRMFTRRELWNGNYERLSTFFSKDSIILYAMKTHHRRRRTFPRLFAQPEHAHVRVVRLHSPRAARAWLATIASEEMHASVHLGARSSG